MTYLEEDAERAIQLFMAERAVSRDEALRLIVRDWMVGHGYLRDVEVNLGGEPDSEANPEAILGGA